MTSRVTAPGVAKSTPATSAPQRAPGMGAVTVKGGITLRQCERAALALQCFFPSFAKSVLKFAPNKVPGCCYPPSLPTATPYSHDYKIIELLHRINLTKIHPPVHSLPFFPPPIPPQFVPQLLPQQAA